MQEHKTKIGKHILKILMFSMYPDSKTIYREYIQNACDSINEAVKNGIISPKEGQIHVKINENNNSIQINDNGTGIKSDKVASTLKDIADSDKDGIDTIGVYGIGRLVGAGYCQKLVFKTSYKGEPIGSKITFDVMKVRKIIDDKNDKRSAAEVIDDITTIETFEENIDKHYFHATLNGIREEYPELLEESKICNYLKEIAPIDYIMPFKSKLIKPSLSSEFQPLHEQIKSCRISINNITDIRKMYDLTIGGTGDEIHSLEYFKIEDDTYGLLAWGWYGVTAMTRAIPSSVKYRGIRLRKHNVQVGDSILLNQYSDDSRVNNYFIGELHVVHENINPEGSRAGLAPTPETEKLKIHIKNTLAIYKNYITWLIMQKRL